MAYTAPTNEPSALRAGDTWSWRREDLGDYPASSWTLKYYFRNSSAKFDATATADGDDFEVTVAKATTAGYTVGWYDWIDRKSTRLNSSHQKISYAVFCLKKKKKK